MTFRLKRDKNWKNNLILTYADEPSRARAELLCASGEGFCLRAGGEFDANQFPFLSVDASGVSLHWRENGEPRTLHLDFISGRENHRRHFGGGKSQAIAKACGIKGRFRPTILDCTAGQGRDAFVLASLGCKMHLLERSLAAYTLLNDALERAAQSEDETLKQIVSRIFLQYISAHDHLIQAEPDSVDLVYLDPMFPERKKSALVKKEMRIFHTLIGADDDADTLLESALRVAKYRVVVKRPRAAPPLSNTPPALIIDGKSTRFDVYTKARMPV